jgi:hypothetical protein
LQVSPGFSRVSCQFPVLLSPGCWPKSVLKRPNAVSPYSNLPEILAALVRHAAARRQRRSTHPATDPGPQADERERPRHDGQLHPHPSRDAVAADRAGPSALASVAAVRGGKKRRGEEPGGSTRGSARRQPSF